MVRKRERWRERDGRGGIEEGKRDRERESDRYNKYREQRMVVVGSVSIHEIVCPNMDRKR